MGKGITKRPDESLQRSVVLLLFKFQYAPFWLAVFSPEIVGSNPTINFTLMFAEWSKAPE
jgi:hypothetical protein